MNNKPTKSMMTMLSIIALLFCSSLFAQTVNVGSASYTKTFPGVDEAGRNAYPSGSPYIIGNAAGKPVPTNDWWSAKLNSDHVSNLFSYPITMKTVSSGLVMSYIPWGVIDDYEPITIGVSSLNASRANISDYSDWTVTMDWASGTNNFTATMGIAMPFVYFTKNSTDVAQVKINAGTITVDDEVLIIQNAHRGGSFAIYAPSGSSWTKNGNTYTSTLNGKNYFSAAILPTSASSIVNKAIEYKKYAYVFPKNTETSWQYNESTSIIRTDFTITPDVKEGTESTVLFGLLPHQWNNIASNSSAPAGDSYSSVRGEIKMASSNTFAVENTFYGILPTLPNVSNYSDGFNPSELNNKISAIENDALATWTDSYNDGQVLNRLIQAARIADLTGNTVARDKMIATVKERLEDWLSYESGEVAFLFYYNTTWSAMIGYPAGHGQDGNLNDHHFHWGYFIHAAAFVEQFEPGWAAEWGDMINLLVRDAASPNREDELFPFLRNFSPYAGHCWANGFATFPQGNDQESTSESMQFNSSLIHWGSITGNDEVRDLGIYLYTTEQTAIEEYWFDMYERNFKDDQQFSLVSRVWGNSYDNGTFWTSDIAASYGIEMYPIHGGSLYLGQNHAYVDKLWTEITQNTGILSNEENPNLWHDVMWEYLAFIDAAKAIEMYDSYPERELKFGITDVQTYHWLHAMNALGKVDASVTADYPVAAVFNKEGERTYTAHNYTNEAITVTFSDGAKLDVPAGAMATSKDVAIEATINSLFDKAYTGGNLPLTVEVSEGTPSKVEFYNGTQLLAAKTTAPYTYNAENLNAGNHAFYARVYEGDDFIVTNIVSCTVGQQQGYLGAPNPIPGTIEAGHYNKFEGGKGQGIAYYDMSQGNAGDFRVDEDVDAITVNGEGATVGWISSGEWINYSVEVEKAGYYNIAIRYASGNNSGGGPFDIILDDVKVAANVHVSSSGGWDRFSTKMVNNVPFKAGENILRLSFAGGELNIGKLTFSFVSDLTFDQPIADAGDNFSVVLPTSSATLDAGNSVSPGGLTLSYQWTQLYGSTLVSFDNDKSVSPQISNLEEGVYAFNVEVSNGEYTDNNEVLVIVGDGENRAPTVRISAPSNNATYKENTNVTISASASDLDGNIEKVEFYEGEKLIATDSSAPYSISWSNNEGSYSITAVATDNDGQSTTSQAITIVMQGVNIALNKATQTSSNENAGTPGSHAVDGDATSRWSSLFADPQWIYVDLEEAYDIKQVVLKWEGAFGEAYQIQVSDDASNWTTIYTESAGDGDEDIINVTGTGRYVRIYGTKRGTPYGYSLFEIEIYGSKSGSSNIEDTNMLEFSVYPNPANEVLNIQAASSIDVISIYSIAGHKLITEQCHQSFKTIDISRLRNGMYIIEVESVGAVAVRRFIKQ